MDLAVTLFLIGHFKIPDDELMMMMIVTYSVKSEQSKVAGVNKLDCGGSTQPNGYGGVHYRNSSSITVRS